MQFTDLIGYEVSLLIPRIHPKALQPGVLVGVEPAGLWFESQEAMNELLQTIGAKTAAYNLAFFVPFHEIGYVMTRGSGQALNEKSFGV